MSLEILLTILIFSAIFGFIGQAPTGPIGVLWAWGYLGFLSGMGRLLAFSAPSSAPFAMRIGIVLSGIAGVVSLWKARGRWLPALRGDTFLFASFFLLVFVWNFFPQFDVDSLNYHLPGVIWDLEHAKLNAFQQTPEVYSLWYYWLGFEEYLSVAGYGSRLDFALFAALNGAVFKIMGMLSVWLLLPKQAIALRLAGLFILLLDQHFFFSGLNRFVYISPALVGLGAVSLYFAWRCLRGKTKDGWYAISAGLGMVAVKYHGLYLFVFILGIVGLGWSWWFLQRKSWRTYLSFASTREIFLLLGLPFVCLVVHLIRIVYTGSPIPPYHLGPFRSELTGRGIERLEDLLFDQTIWDVLVRPYEAMMYPAIFANKMVTLLAVPVFAVWAISLFRPRWSSRSMQLAVLGFVFTFFWGLLSYYIRADESRYARYVFGAATLSLLFAFVALRRWKPKWISRKSEIFLSYAFGVLLFANLFWRIDHKVTNLPLDVRPNWSHHLQFWKWYATHKAPYFSATTANEYMKGLMVPLNHGSIPGLAHCVEELAKKEGDEALLLGKDMFVIGPNSVWPSYLVAPLASMASISEGGGYLRFTSVQEVNYRWALLPTDAKFRDSSIVYKSEPNLEEKRVSFRETPLCSSGEMALYSLSDSL